MSMGQRPHHNELSKRLEVAKDARDVFRYFFRKAELWPDHLMSPKHGKLKRVVLLTEAFSDRTIDILERLPNLDQLFQGLEEIRLVETRITPKGVMRLKALFPMAKVNPVTHDRWKANVNIANAGYDFEVNKMDPVEADPTEGNAEVGRRSSEDLFNERYGKRLKHPDEA